MLGNSQKNSSRVVAFCSPNQAHQATNKHSLTMVKRKRTTSKRNSSNESIARITFLALCTRLAQASPLPQQHRVPPALRRVPYHHELQQGQSRRELEKFWIPSSKQRENTRVRESWEHGQILQNSIAEERYWSYLVDAVQEQAQPQPQSPQDSSSSDSSHFLRRLYDQFVGADAEPGADSGIFSDNATNETFEQIIDMNVTNVTTEVEFGSKLIDNATLSNESSIDESSSFMYTTSQEQNNEFQPLRIRAILSESSGYGKYLSAEERSMLFHDMLSPALVAWSAALRVDPVIGNLTVDKLQLLDGQTCGPGKDSGLPSILVPLEHITEGIPDTDMLVYLSLGFTSPPFTSPPENTAGTTAPAASATEDQKNDRLTRAGNVTGDVKADEFYNETELNTSTFDGLLSGGNILDVNNATFSANTTDALNSTMTNATNATQAHVCIGDYLAAASFCSTDQYDRPTAAMLHICIDETFFDPAFRNRNIMTLMHELGHALGFNSLSMAHFRKPDGTPITRRAHDGTIPDSKVECTGPTSERRSATVALPSEEILQFRTVRGGVRVAELVTPSIVQVVRNQFGCQKLTGAELESGEALPLAKTTEEHGCLGDHWERRLFSSDLMNPIIGELEFTTRISTLTLAYFADSGWYQVDLSRAEVAAGWGRGAGCSFVDDTCIGKNGEVPPQNEPYFCNDVPSELSRAVASDIHGCTPDLSRKALCSIGQYDLDLPHEYQYFMTTYGSDVGGADPFMDYCPVYSGFANGLCSIAENEIHLKASSMERFGERNSRCLVGSMETGKKTALCLPIACVIEDRSLRIKVNGIWMLCEADQALRVSEHSVMCPNPRRVCPTFFCPYDCLGTGGRCDYESGKCLCVFNGGKEMQTCGHQDEDDPKKQTPFLRPTVLVDEKGHPGMPHPDSPLADYYVVTKESLKNDPTPLLETWAIILASFGGLLLATGFVLIVSKKRNVEEDGADWFRRENVIENDGMFGNRNKDKMVATVLVDMRIHNGEESIIETDSQITESEPSAGGRSESMSDISRRSVSEDPDGTQEDILEEDIHGTAMTEAQTIIRRRNINGETVHSSLK